MLNLPGRSFRPWTPKAPECVSIIDVGDVGPFLVTDLGKSMQGVAGRGSSDVGHFGESSTNRMSLITKITGGGSLL
jgi:hypothetical protein